MPDTQPLLTAARQFADNILQHGRNLYPHQDNPLIADGIDLKTLKGARIDVGAEVVEGAVLSNPACQQHLLRMLTGLTNLTGDPKYREAAEAVFRHMFNVLSDKNGLFHWGGHKAFDLEKNQPVTGKSGPHELKCHYPFYDLMWEIDPEGTKRYIEAVWNAHIYDWAVLDFSRHGKYDIEIGKLWQHDYRGGRIFFVGRGLTFINCGSDLYYAAGMLHHLTGEDLPLVWAKRLNNRFVETRDPATGMGGYQFTLRYLPGAPYWTDRAIHQFSGQLAGHFVAEGAISPPNKIQTITCNAGICRMVLSERLGDPGQVFGQSAVEDLIAYGRWAYEAEDNTFHAVHTDGTRLTDIVFELDGYFGKKGGRWVPAAADGLMFRAYAMAYRLSQNPVDRAFLWQMVRNIARGNGLGDIGNVDGGGALNMETDNAHPGVIHGLRELYRATERQDYLTLAARVAQNILAKRFKDGFFTSNGIALVDDPAPLALLCLIAEIEGKPEQVPVPCR